MNINNSKGVFFMLLGVLIVPWLDGFAKLLGQSLPFSRGSMGKICCSVHADSSFGLLSFWKKYV